MTKQNIYIYIYRYKKKNEKCAVTPVSSLHKNVHISIYNLESFPFFLLLVLFPALLSAVFPTAAVSSPVWPLLPVLDQTLCPGPAPTSCFHQTGEIG